MSAFWNVIKAGAKTETGKKIVDYAIKKTPRKYKVAPDITKVAPTVSKNLSWSTRGKQLSGWIKNLQKKELKDFEKTKKVSEIKKKKKKKKD